MFRFFGGKGGVGKTTCAAATALGFARRGEATVAISTDPAHSLGDVLGKKLSSKPVRVAKRLDALELAADAALDRWLDTRRDLLTEIADRGTWLDRSDIQRFLALSFPGVDELVALLEIARIAEAGGWDEVVIDTAPTGHTLRMLAMPATLERVAAILDAMQGKHRVIAESLGGRRSRDAADELIDEIRADAERLAALLRDPARSSFHWVTTAEPLALAEAADGVAALTGAGIPVAELFVNRLTPKPSTKCELCAARHDSERERLDAAGPPLDALPRREILDLDRATLARVEKAIFSARSPRRPSRRRSPRNATRGSTSDRVSPEVAALPIGKARLVLVGGKGGVGKSTCAAAIALDLAARDPSARVLLLSIDPAHSLGDALAQALSDEERRVIGAPPNLRARELDATSAFLRVRDRFRGAVDDLFDRMRGGSRFDAAHDRAIVRDLLDLSPPGLDEIFAILAVVEALGLGTAKRGAFDLVVLDTAPTGHALRLLEMPERASAWVKTLLEVLLKYRGVLKSTALAEDLVALSKGLRALRELLRDPARTAFVAVARPEPVVVAETSRLVAALEEMGIPLRVLLVNALTPPSGCARCRGAARRETASVSTLAALASRSANTAIIHAPRVAPPPRGAEALRDLRRTWYDPGAAMPAKKKRPSKKTKR